MKKGDYFTVLHVTQHVSPYTRAFVVSTTGTKIQYFCSVWVKAFIGTWQGKGGRGGGSLFLIFFTNSRRNRYLFLSWAVLTLRETQCYVTFYLKSTIFLRPTKLTLLATPDWVPKIKGQFCFDCFLPKTVTLGAPFRVPPHDFQEGILLTTRKHSLQQLLKWIYRSVGSETQCL